MTDDSKILAESLSAEAAQAAAVHAEATEKARTAQMHSVVISALKEILTQGDEGTKRLLIQKIPLLCTDIMRMKDDITLIKKIGGWILLGIGTLFLTLVGSLLLKGI